MKDDPNTWPLKEIDAVKEAINTGAGPRVVSAPAIVDDYAEIREKPMDLARFSKLDEALRTTALVGKIAKLWTLSTDKRRSTSIDLRVINKFDSDKEITSTDVEPLRRFLSFKSKITSKSENHKNASTTRKLLKIQREYFVTNPGYGTPLYLLILNHPYSLLESRS